MQDKPSFVKLSSLVGSYFKVVKVDGYKFKMWDTATSKMSVSDTWKEDHRKLWSVVTEQGTIDISQSQMGSMLEAVAHNGKADIIGSTFSVKSNGKTGIEIRYYLNLVKDVIDNPLEDPFY